MEKVLALLLVTLTVAYAVPDPRGIIINLVRGSSGEKSSEPPGGDFFLSLALDLCVAQVVPSPNLGLPEGWEVRRPFPRDPREGSTVHAQRSASTWLKELDKNPEPWAPARETLTQEVQ